jgi:hypothetical protein
LFYCQEWGRKYLEYLWYLIKEKQKSFDLEGFDIWGRVSVWGEGHWQIYRYKIGVSNTDDFEDSPWEQFHSWRVTVALHSCSSEAAEDLEVVGNPSLNA